MRFAPIIGCLAIVGAACSPAQETPAPLSEGYDHFYNLEYDEAIAAFSIETQQNPDDPNAWNHLAHGTLYRAMHRSGALESELVTGSNSFIRRPKVKTTPSEDQEFYDCIGKALDLVQSRLKENEDDPRALASLGISYALRANYNFLVRKAWTDALHDATDARKAHKRLTEIEPDNVDARLIPAVYDYVTGSLAIGYRILGFLAGYHGDRNRGIEALQTVAKEGKSNRPDAEILLIAIYRREHRPQDAIPLLQDLSQRFPRNSLLRFEIVQMYADLGDKAAALAELDRIRNLKQNGAPGFAALMPEKIDYLEGNLLFWYDDLDPALDHMKRVTAKAHDLDLNTALMSWMRLGQIYDLKGRHASAVPAYRKAIAMMPQSEIGKESRRYITQPYKRPATAESAADSRPSRSGIRN